MLRCLFQGKATKERVPLFPPFRSDRGNAWMAAAPWPMPDDMAGWRDGLTTCLYEDGVRLLHAHAPHDAIRISGGGLYSHFGRRIWFSTSDNSDPNTNGRRYEVDFTLDLATWKRAFLEGLTPLWDLHPEAAFFRAQGGGQIPPPIFCSLGLTNKCNLRCEICGSQKYLDETGVLRRHMDIGRFEAVARTLFPVVAEVELNSQGDPLLHPQIERVLEVVAEHRCDLKVQTNGTLFTDRVIELLCRQPGTVMLSLDAVGPRFDEVRRGGVWARAEPGLEKFLRRRDPARLSVGIYPTVTRRTAGDALAIVQWAHDHDVDEVAFHRYIPIQNSFEEAPGTDELQVLSNRLDHWAAGRRHPLKVTLDGDYLSRFEQSRRTIFADPVKHRFAALVSAMMAPRDRTMNNADPATICVAPDHYVEIGLDGQIAACCRAQDVTLGFATSPQAFAKAWFGNNYRAIRASLQRDAPDPFPLPNCEACIGGFAPASLRGRHAVDYQRPAETGTRLEYSDWSELRLEVAQKERGHCHIAVLPPGVPLPEYQLFEDDRLLGPGESLHDDIRQHGGGRYSLWGRAVYFSASDNSDARYNGRNYVLKRATETPPSLQGTDVGSGTGVFSAAR
jgi:MoaA/NifB/PqqE/SkfB family radical SAM enzyme